MKKFYVLWASLAALFLGTVAGLDSASRVAADDFFLTIAGGYSPSGNQASLEKNVLFFQRFLRDQKLEHRPSDIYFADGHANRNSLQVKDLEGLPPANRLMAEFFGSTRNLGVQYRAHQVPDIRGETSPENIHKWFAQNGKKMKSGDRLFLYVTAHGGSSRDDTNSHDTTIYLWNNKRIKVSELAKQLDSLPKGVNVITVMVQCHAGGFANLIFENGNPENGLSQQNRCGFFATVYDRPAAGCTPNVNEADYQEYSTYFWAALGGESRVGERIDLPDYDQDGRVAFDEAHAYTVLTSDTIDLPIKTSGEFLRAKSKFRVGSNARLLSKNTPYSEVLRLAGPVDRAILTGLSQQLGLSGDDRIEKARDAGQRRNRSTRRTRSTQSRRGNRALSPREKLRREIASDVKKRWPQLANVLNPKSVELLTSDADDFVAAIESHDKYDEYRELTDKSKSELNATEKRVKYERFVRIAENVILAANLEKTGSPTDKRTYQRILNGESGSLGN